MHSACIIAYAETVNLPTPSPQAAGYRFPAEWEPHAATWTNYPYDDSYWQGELEPVRQEVCQLIAHIARFEPVMLGVNDEECAHDAQQRFQQLGAPMAAITLQPRPYNDIWFRDSGPLFVTNGTQLALTDWHFNGWGNKYPHAQDDASPAWVAQQLGVPRWSPGLVLEGGAIEMNSRGLCLTTRSCLLSPQRNPALSEADYARALHDFLGVQQLLWLESGLEDDHTDGHIDTIVRFCDDDTIVYHMPDDVSDPNHQSMQANLRILRAARTPQGTPYKLIALPQPAPRYLDDGTRLALSYANFYIGNGFVLVPHYDDPEDARALAILQACFVGREVMGSSAKHLITGGGAFHCITQQQPATNPKEAPCQPSR